MFWLCAVDLDLMVTFFIIFSSFCLEKSSLQFLRGFERTVEEAFTIGERGFSVQNGSEPIRRRSSFQTRKEKGKLLVIHVLSELDF